MPEIQGVTLKFAISCLRISSRHWVWWPRRKLLEFNSEWKWLWHIWYPPCSLPPPEFWCPPGIGGRPLYKVRVRNFDREKAITKYWSLAPLLYAPLARKVCKAHRFKHSKQKTLSAFAYLRQASKILGQGQLHHVRLCHFVPEEIGLHLWVCLPLNQENLRIVCSSLCELSKSAGSVE